MERDRLSLLCEIDHNKLKVISEMDQEKLSLLKDIECEKLAIIQQIDTAKLEAVSSMDCDKLKAISDLDDSKFQTMVQMEAIVLEKLNGIEENILNATSQLNETKLDIMKEMGSNLMEIIKSLSEETLRSIKEVDTSHFVFWTNMERHILVLLQSMDVRYLKTFTGVDEHKTNLLGKVDSPSLDSMKWLDEGILSIMKQLDESILKSLKDTKQQLQTKINNLIKPSGPKSFEDLIEASTNIGLKNAYPAKNPMKVSKGEVACKKAENIIKSEPSANNHLVTNNATGSECSSNIENSNVKRKRVDESPTMDDIAKKFGFDIDKFNVDGSSSTTTSNSTNHNSRWDGRSNQKKSQGPYNGFAQQRRKRKRICSWPNKTYIPQEFQGGSQYDDNPSHSRWQNMSSNPHPFQPFNALGNQSYSYGRNRYHSQSSWNSRSSWNYYR